jgi:hypothetical protein
VRLRLAEALFENGAPIEAHAERRRAAESPELPHDLRREIERSAGG